MSITVYQPWGIATNGDNVTLKFSEAQLETLRGCLKSYAEWFCSCNGDCWEIENLLAIIISTEVVVNERQLFNIEKCLKTCRAEAHKTVKKKYTEVLDVIQSCYK